MYDSLLIRSGGGIVKESDLIRTTGSPALIIGLGGLGADALRALKKKMNVRMVPPHQTPPVPHAAPYASLQLTPRPTGKALRISRPASNI